MILLHKIYNTPREKPTMTENLTTTEDLSKRFITKVPFFYGWIIMAIGTLGMIMTSPGQTYTESIFIEFLIKDLAISRSLVSSLYAIGTLIGGLSLPFWGKQVDRHGVRKMVTIVAILFGLSCIFMGFVQNALMIGIGFLLVRMLGQGSLQLVSQTSINQWWVRKRGMIMGISGLLLAILGMGGFPSLVYWLISISDWRMTYIILGLGLLLIMAPMGYFFFRNRPEEYQLLPDGVPYDHASPTDQIPGDFPLEENWTLKEALHTRAFWVFGLSLSFFVLVITGITFHIVSIFQTQGLGPSLAASVFLPLAITAALTTLLVGYLSDHVPLNFLFAGSMVLLAISLLMAQWLNGVGSVLLFGIIFGISNGAIRALGSVIWPSFYGRKHLGSIFGFTSSITVIGAAIGPLPFGFVYDMIGSYRPVLWVLAILSIGFGLAGLLTRKPSKG